MATKLFLRETTTTGVADYRDMVTTAGAGATTAVVNSTDSGTEIQWTKTAGGVAMTWISGRAPVGGFTLAGTMTMSIWAHESATTVNAGGRVRVYIRSVYGDMIEVGGGPWDDGVEFTKDTPTEMTWTGDPTDAPVAENERIVVKFYITNIGVMKAGTCTLTYDAADAATGDSFFQINETITFKPESEIATVDGLAKASVGTVDQLATASVKTWAGLT